MLKWSDQYNCHQVRLSNGFKLNVNWDSMRPKDGGERESGFSVYALGIKYPSLVRELPEAKKTAITFAKVLIQKLTEDLKDE